MYEKEDTILNRILFGLKKVRKTAQPTTNNSKNYKSNESEGRHPAALNFGDSFAYGLARARNESLLFIGQDFAQTDIRSALEL